MELVGPEPTLAGLLAKGGNKCYQNKVTIALCYGDSDNYWGIYNR